MAPRGHRPHLLGLPRLSRDALPRPERQAGAEEGQGRQGASARPAARAAPGQLHEGDLEEAEERGEEGGDRRLLQAPRARRRGAARDDPVRRRGRDGVPRARLRPAHRAVRPLVRQRQARPPALRPQRLHRRRREGAPAALPRVRPRRRRELRPAAQRLPRDAPGQRRHPPHPQGPRRQDPRRARGHAEEPRRRLRGLLRAVRPPAQGGRPLRLGELRPTPRPLRVPVDLLRGRHEARHTQGIRLAHARGAEGDLLPLRRHLRGREELARPRGVPRARLRGALLRRPDGRVLRRARPRVRRQEAPRRGPRRARPRRPGGEEPRQGRQEGGDGGRQALQAARRLPEGALLQDRQGGAPHEPPHRQRVLLRRGRIRRIGAHAARPQGVQPARPGLAAHPGAQREVADGGEDARARRQGRGEGLARGPRGPALRAGAARRGHAAREPRALQQTRRRPPSRRTTPAPSSRTPPSPSRADSSPTSAPPPTSSRATPARRSTTSAPPRSSRA